MTTKHIKLFTVVTVSLSILLLLAWLVYDPTRHFFVYEPGMDMPENYESSASKEQVVIGEHFKHFADHTSTLTEKWPNFRGSNHDNILTTSYPVNDNWKLKEPRIAWSVATGEGHAAPAIYDGLVYFIDYDEELRADVLKCFVLETGQELWRRWYHVQIKRNHGMSRTIPAVNESVVLTMGPRCHVMCVDRLTGDLRWGIDLEKQYNTETPLWYTGQCPIIVDNVAVIAVGGSSLFIGVDILSGEVLWETPNPGALKMSHSSLTPMTIHGKKTLVYSAIGGVCAISAEKEDMGTLLWENKDWAPSVIAPAPVYLGNQQVYITGGYGAGGAILNIGQSNGKFSATLAQKFAPQEGLASEQQTAIVHKGYIYGITPKDAGANRNQFMCYAVGDLTKPVWQSERTNRYGLGPFMLINDKFLILNDEGTLSMIEASTTGFTLLNQHRFFEGHDAWGPFAFANGYLLLRDSQNIYCLDLRP